MAKEALKKNDQDYLLVEGARQNNLKNLSLKIPHNKLTVITGISGSGKSSLAFDTIYAEGQWRFIECMSSYARVFIEKLPRPEVDRIENLRPTIALEQRNPVKGSRATVGTHTEIYDYLRILFSKIAKPVCPLCNQEIRAWTVQSIVEEILKRFNGKRVFILFESRERPEILLKEGFTRALLFDGESPLVKELYELKDMEEPLFVLADRLRVSDSSRIADSVKIAFQKGEVRVYSLEDRLLISFPKEPRCPQCGKTVSTPTPLLFSFNHPQGACPECKGFGYVLSYDESFIIPDQELSLSDGAVEIFERPSLSWWKEQLIRGAKLSGIDVNTPFRLLSDEHKRTIFRGNQYFYGIDDFLEELERKRYKIHVRVFLSKIRKPTLCPLCRGKRLREEALIYKIQGYDIGDLNSLSVEKAKDWLENLSLSNEQRKIAEEVVKVILEKLSFLERVGLGYLTLDRQIKTLSGGEYQRLNLSNQLSNRLTSTLYVLDEPTVGLHPRDTERIIEVLKEITDYGNTVVVVEHDREVIESADWIVELGPEAGAKGGDLVFSGVIEDFFKVDTYTSRYLKVAEKINLERRNSYPKNFITLRGARGHNLKNLTVRIPLNALTVVTGVSGSGKSSLIVDTLYRALVKEIGLENADPLPYEEIDGVRKIKTVKLIDQSPIGKSPKSIPVTYLGLYGKIRELFASLRESKLRGFGPGHFSLNSPLGQCPKCKGEGFIRVEMYFFEDLFLPCDECDGKRFKKEILEVKYKEKNIHDVLSLTFDQAYEFFSEETALREKISVVRDLGLGYLLLGQPATTLSGGESQRLKICEEILNSATTRKSSNLKGYLYILDEPTVGLHYEDVKKFLHVVRKLIDRSATVVIIEHNLDVVAQADWIIDLGPEGGDRGGYLLFEGSLSGFLETKDSYTAKFLKAHLES